MAGFHSGFTDREEALSRKVTILTGPYMVMLTSKELHGTRGCQERDITLTSSSMTMVAAHPDTGVNSTSRTELRQAHLKLI